MIIKLYSPTELSFFPVYLETAEVCRLQEEINRPKGFKNHHLFSIADGEGVLTIDKKTHYIKKDDMIYIGNNVPHGYYGLTPDFKTNFITFFGDGVEKIKEYYGIGKYEIFRNKNAAAFEKRLDEIIATAHYLGEVAPLCTLTQSAVVDFFEAVTKVPLSPIEAVYKFIEANYSEMLTLDDLMNVYSYSKSKLCSDFKEKYGITIFDMITDLRLRKAHHIISINPHLHNKKIAEECGFRDISYFCKVYKKKYGVSPKEKNE